MFNFKKKHNEPKQSDCFEFIKRNLTNEFKIIDVKNVYSFPPEWAGIIFSTKSYYVKAKILDTNEIHLKIENIDGFVYEGFITDYKWFLNTFSL